MTRVVVLICFLVAFAAGLAVGLQSHREVPVPTTQPERRGGWLVAELKLTPEQQAQMNKIWSETAGRGWGEREERRRKLTHDRDEAIAALIRPEDKARFEEIRKNHADQLTALDHQMQEAYQSAVDQTKGILTAEQREKYETILKNRSHGPGGRDWDRGSRGWDRRGRTRERGRQGDERATSQPASSQSE